jgi:hypothetical protein
MAAPHLLHCPACHTIVDATPWRGRYSFDVMGEAFAGLVENADARWRTVRLQ